MSVKPNKTVEYYRQKYPLTFSTQPSECALEMRYKKAWQIAEEAACVLKRDFGASRVAAFGSLTDCSLFNQWSDIDLAVWGVPDNRFYASVGVVTALSSDFKIDLVDAEDCKEYIKKAIETRGIEI